MKKLMIVAFLVGSPVFAQPWEDMDYGDFLSAAIEVTEDNIACKGIAIPLAVDGSRAMMFDTDTLRWASGWHGDFVQLRGIVYDGPHGIWPKIDGQPDWVTAREPGVSLDGNFTDPRPDGFGPLPDELGQWRGLVRTVEGPVLSYEIGRTSIRELAEAVYHDQGVAYTRHISFGGPTAAVIKVADVEFDSVRQENGPTQSSIVLLQNNAPVFAAALASSPATSPEIRLDVIDASVVLRIPATRTDLLNRAGATLMISPVSDEHDIAALRRALRNTAQRDLFTRPPALARQWTDEPETTVVRDYQANSDMDTRRIVMSPQAEDLRVQLNTPHAYQPRLYARDGMPVSDTSMSASETAVVFGPWTNEESSIEPLVGWNCDEGEGLSLIGSGVTQGVLRLNGVTWRRGVSGRSLDFDGTANAVWNEGADIEFTETDLTVSAWISTTKDGVIFAQTKPEGPWVPDGKTLFVRNGRLCYDVGWVGVIESDVEVADGAWHHVAMAWQHESARVVLYVDGSEVARGELGPREPVDDDVWRFGFCAPNFPGQPSFSGYMDGIRVFDSCLDVAAIGLVAAESGTPIVDVRVVRGNLDATWHIDETAVTLHANAVGDLREGEILSWRGPLSELPGLFARLASADSRRVPFEIDRLTWPAENPYASWLRFGDFDFLDDGRAAAISTWNGDVWRVDGLDRSDGSLRWQRLATGLSQPLGLKTRNEDILVVGRDQITRLLDLNGDRETDVYENFNDDTMNTEHFHEPCSGLQADSNGFLYYAKAARHAKVSRHAQHGTVIVVAPDGSASIIAASGLRAPNGMWVDDDGTMWTSDQEGHWMPANRINRITAGGFYGNNWSGTGTPQEDYDRPLCWIHPSVDRSPSAQVRVPEGMWGDLSGALLGMSYGTGEVYRILEDEVDGVHQGGIVPLPIQIPTGAMRGRFNPRDGHLYLCGLFGWSSDQTEPGGFYRVRRTDASRPMPVHVRAVSDGLVMRFNEPIVHLNGTVDGDVSIEAWNYRWSANYGSPSLTLDDGTEGRTNLEVATIHASDDGRTVWLQVPEMQPAMQMHVEYALPCADASTAESFVHLTVHAVSARSGSAFVGR